MSLSNLSDTVNKVAPALWMSISQLICNQNLLLEYEKFLLEYEKFQQKWQFPN